MMLSDKVTAKLTNREFSNLPNSNVVSMRAETPDSGMIKKAEFNVKKIPNSKKIQLDEFDDFMSVNPSEGNQNML
jgi:hypothetical protein